MSNAIGHIEGDLPPLIHWPSLETHRKGIKGEMDIHITSAQPDINPSFFHDNSSKFGPQETKFRPTPY
jgi:hypothetical protein